jgi:hypothetical protein
MHKNKPNWLQNNQLLFVSDKYLSYVHYCPTATTVTTVTTVITTATSNIPTIPTTLATLATLATPAIPTTTLAITSTANMKMYDDSSTINALLISIDSVMLSASNVMSSVSSVTLSTSSITLSVDRVAISTVFVTSDIETGTSGIPTVTGGILISIGISPTSTDSFLTFRSFFSKKTISFIISLEYSDTDRTAICFECNKNFFTESLKAFLCVDYQKWMHYACADTKKISLYLTYKKHTQTKVFLFH